MSLRSLPILTQTIPSENSKRMSGSWHSAFASVVLPYPPAPCSAVVRATDPPPPALLADRTASLSAVYSVGRGTKSSGREPSVM